MEIERCTLATGETAVTGFSRMWVVGVVFGFARCAEHFPGWAVVPPRCWLPLRPERRCRPHRHHHVPARHRLLVATPLRWSTTPSRVELVLVAIIVVFLLVAIVIATNLSAWTGIVTDAPQGVANLPRYLAEIGTATIFSGVVFAGAGGAQQPRAEQPSATRAWAWGYIPRIVSPITGEEEARPSFGYKFPAERRTCAAGGTGGRWQTRSRSSPSTS